MENRLRHSSAPRQEASTALQQQRSETKLGGKREGGRMDAGEGVSKHRLNPSISQHVTK
jgi:hypothetical protein